MNEEIINDSNCIVKAFENNPISIISEQVGEKKIYYFRASDIGKALGIVNIHSAIQNFDEDERVIRKAYDTEKRIQDTIFLPSQGVYRLLFNSKKPEAKKFRKWAGNILDDIIFNDSKELKRQLDEQQKKYEEKLLENQIELDNTKKQLELKTKLKVKKWYDKEPGHVIYGYISSDSGSLITIGKTKNIKVRESSYMTHNQNGEMFYIRKCYNCDLSEKVLHHILDKYRVERLREWFDISKELAIYIIDMVCDFLDKFISCSEKLPDFRIKEFIDKLNIKYYYTTLEKDNSELVIPNIVYNNDITNYEKFISEFCEIGNEFTSLPYNLIAAYRIWTKGDMIYKNEFLNYIKEKYIKKDSYENKLVIRSHVFIGIRPKEFEFKILDNNQIKKYEKFCKEKCMFGYSYRITFVKFIQNYINWLKINHVEYKYTINDDIEIKEYFNKRFLIQYISGQLGIWGIQLKTDKLPMIIDTYRNKIYKINVDTKKIIKTYYGLSEISEEFNLTLKTVSNHIKYNKIIDDTCGKIKILLKYEDDRSIIFNKRTTLKKVYKFDYNTKKILDTFDGIIGAATKLNISTTTVGKYIKTQKTFNDNNVSVLLSYHDDITNIVEKVHVKQFVKSRLVKKIYKINIDNNEILETYNGILDASVKLNIGECTVSRYLKSGKTMNLKLESDTCSPRLNM